MAQEENRKRNRRGGRRGQRERPEYDQKLLDLARVTRVVKGGRRFRFRATLVIGNHRGKVGVGVAKGADVSGAIQKAYHSAEKNLVTVRLTGTTIAHEVTKKLGSALVLIKPGREGQGIIAGGAVRAVVDLAGIKDVVSKSLGSSNKLTVARATVAALGMLKTERPLNTRQARQDKEAKVVETVQTTQ